MVQTMYAFSACSCSGTALLYSWATYAVKEHVSDFYFLFFVDFPNVVLKEALLSLDKALRYGAGIALSDFQPEQVPARLGPHTSRFYVPWAELPDDVREATGVRVSRSCLLHETSNETQMEVMVEQDARMLVVWSDQGPKQWAGLCYLEYTNGLRLLAFPDGMHRRQNNALSATRQCGMVPLRTCATAVMNLLSGPWSENANLGKLAGAFEEWTRTRDETDGLF
eukprot:2652759-Amphidinium_carterae.1